MRQRDIFWFWLPLFASWLLMTAESPMISAMINRLPDEVIMLAAQGIVVSLSVTIESPIINLLATSTFFVKDRASYLMVRRFTIHLALLLTLITALIAFTPVFDLVVITLLKAPPDVARWVQPGMRIMTLWSAAIAWRRFLQGALIRFNQTRKVAFGTGVRLLTSGTTIFVMTQWVHVPGVIGGATALMTGVIMEAIYVTIAIQPLLKSELNQDRPQPDGQSLNYSELFWFHLPLASTSLLLLLAQPLVTSSLSRLAQPKETLAAWPVLFHAMLMARAAAFALPEVVIALTKGPKNLRPIRQFTFTTAGILTTLMLVLTFTPAGSFYFSTIQDMTPVVSQLALSSLGLFILFPALTTVISWQRGLLISYRFTKDVNLGMAINLAATAAILGIGLASRMPGLATAAVALNAAALAEVIYLGIRGPHILPPGSAIFAFRKKAMNQV